MLVKCSQPRHGVTVAIAGLGGRRISIGAAFEAWLDPANFDAAGCAGAPPRGDPRNGLAGARALDRRGERAWPCRPTGRRCERLQHAA